MRNVGGLHREVTIIALTLKYIGMYFINVKFYLKMFFNLFKIAYNLIDKFHL